MMVQSHFSFKEPLVLKSCQNKICERNCVTCFDIFVFKEMVKKNKMDRCFDLYKFIEKYKETTDFT